MILPDYTIVEPWEINKWAVIQMTYNSDNPRPMLIEFDHYMAISHIVLNPPMLRSWATDAMEGKRSHAFYLSSYQDQID